MLNPYTDDCARIAKKNAFKRNGNDEWENADNRPTHTNEHETKWETKDDEREKTFNEMNNSDDIDDGAHTITEKHRFFCFLICNGMCCSSFPLKYGKKNQESTITRLCVGCGAVWVSFSTEDCSWSNGKQIVQFRFAKAKNQINTNSFSNGREFFHLSLWRWSTKLLVHRSNSNNEKLTKQPK